MKNKIYFYYPAHIIEWRVSPLAKYSLKNMDELCINYLIIQNLK